MKEPTRLFDEEPDGFEAALIRAGRRETPSPALRRASALVTGTLAAGAVATKASAATVALKTILVAGAQGMVLGALVTSVVVAVPPLFTAPVAPAPAKQPESIVPQRTRTAFAPPVTPEPARFLPDPVPVATTAPRGGSRAVVVARTEPPRTEREPTPTILVVAPHLRLADEVRTFEGARGALTRGDVATAASELTRYERDFPRGALLLEAQVLRIEILEARGNHSEARALARAFLQANPSVPAARRVRNLLAQGGSDTLQ